MQNTACLDPGKLFIVLGRFSCLLRASHGAKRWYSRIRSCGSAGCRCAQPVPTAVLVSALETIFHDSELCCGKRSTLWSAALSADPHSLKDVGARMQGRYSLGDGRRVTITAEFAPSSSINTSQLLAPLMRGQAALLEWKSHLYVLYGADFDEVRDPSEGRGFDIHKLLLIDVRFSDVRREVALDQKSIGPKELEELLVLSVHTD
jgi:hypothetical protein